MPGPQASQSDGFYNDVNNIVSWAQDTHTLSDEELPDRLFEDQNEVADKSHLLRSPMSQLSGHLGSLHDLA